MICLVNTWLYLGMTHSIRDANQCVTGFSRHILPKEHPVLTGAFLVLLWLSVRFFSFSQNVMSEGRPKILFPWRTIVKLSTNQSELDIFFH